MSIPAAGLESELAAVSGWLESSGIELAKPIAMWPISGGRSNLVFGLKTSDGGRYCLRRPPAGAGPDAAKGLAREYSILASLNRTSVPVPRTVALCADDAVLGAPFFIMELVPGRAYDNAEAIDSLAPDSRRRAGLAMVEALATIHSIDLVDAGLDGLSRPDGYIARQLKRWRGQLTDKDLAAYPLLEVIHGQLADSAPAPQSTALVHGDFKIGNCMLRETGDLVAVLDWQLTTLGDPLADMGWLLASWSTPDETSERIVVPPGRMPGFTAREELLSSYSSLTGLDLSSIHYYEAFSEWKWACIDVGIHKRFSAPSAGSATTVDLRVVRAEIEGRLLRARDLLAVGSPVPGKA